MILGSDCGRDWRHNSTGQPDPNVFGRAGLPTPTTLFKCIAESTEWLNSDKSCTVLYGVRYTLPLSLPPLSPGTAPASGYLRRSV